MSHYNKEVPLKKINRPQLILKGDQEMTMSQLERLKKDERELGHYLKRLQKKGKTRIARTIQKKKEFLASRIQEVEEIYIQRTAA